LIEAYELKKVKYTGIFEDESLSDVMEVLQIKGAFHYTIKRKVVTITP